MSDDPLYRALAYASTVAGQRDPRAVRAALDAAAGLPEALAWSTPDGDRWARARLVELDERWLGEYTDSLGHREVALFERGCDARVWLHDRQMLIREAGWP